MSSRIHPSRTQLVAYVTGESSRVEDTRIEAHLSGCEICTARMAAEARMEIALFDVAERRAAATSAPMSPDRPGSCMNVRRRVGRHVASLSSVAAGLAFFCWLSGDGSTAWAPFDTPSPTRAAGSAENAWMSEDLAPTCEVADEDICEETLSSEVIEPIWGSQISVAAAASSVPECRGEESLDADAWIRECTVEYLSTGPALEGE